MPFLLVLAFVEQDLEAVPVEALEEVGRLAHQHQDAWPLIVS